MIVHLNNNNFTVYSAAQNQANQFILHILFYFIIFVF